MKKVLKNLILSILLLAMLDVSAQVTIGIEEQSVSGAILQLKNITGVPDDDANAHLGLALPRVALSDNNELYPMFLNDPSDPNSGPTAQYVTNKAALKKMHVGLIVYNIVEDDEKDLCLGLNKWDGEKWNCYSQRPTIARFEFDCNSVEVFGIYGDGVALNSSHYLRVTLTVSRIGSYNISATSTPDNGYFFETTGSFLSLGTFTITVPGTGQPVNHTQGADLVDPTDDTPDQFTLVSSGGGPDCNFLNTVISTAVRPEFHLDCKATVVEGMYFEDQPLSTVPNPINGQSHRIKVTLSHVPSSSFGAVAIVETNTVDGFSFRGETVLTSSPQEMYLIGTGIPRGLNDKMFTITSNSESTTASCQVTVYMLIPRKRLMTLGNATGPLYNYNAGLVDTRTPGNSLNAMLTCPQNFGYNQWSILRFAGFKNNGTTHQANVVSTPNTWTDDNRDIICLLTAGWQAMSANRLERLLKGTDGLPPIDVFMIGYDTEFFRGTATSPNAEDLARNNVLIDWVKEGGILMICSEATVSNRNFMNLFFHGTTNPSSDLFISSSEGAGAGAKYTLGFNLGNMPADMRPYYCRDDDPILRGPFEDILGRSWGEDASITRYVTNLPLDEIIIYSGAREIGNTSRPAEGVTIFRHREYPFIFIGDGGFNSGESRTYTGLTVCPFRLMNKTINGRVYNNYPTFRPNYGTAATNAGSVYNAVFSANAFAWCIEKAEEIRRANRD